MTTMNSILNTAQSALLTMQSAISVTGQNIANVDNPNYSVQNVVCTATTPVTTGGQTYGTGVEVEQVQQDVDQLLENRLTQEISTQAALEEQTLYMNLIEDIFDEGTDNGLSTAMDNYWNSWEDLSNNPSGSAQQTIVYESGVSLTQDINSIDSQLGQLSDDLDLEIQAGVDLINELTSQIASLNQAIIAAESSGNNANDLMDLRNGLVDDLGQLMDIDVITKADSSLLINTGNGLPLVSDGTAYQLDMEENRICWNGVSGTCVDITDDISGGQLGGWLELRDAVIPETRAELDELAAELIWAMNYQHSQGAGEAYYSGPVEGTYTTGDSELLASYGYGDEIDYSSDFSMIIQDMSSSETEFQVVEVDMGISRAEVTALEGSCDANSTYELTVVDAGVIGEQIVAHAQGDALGMICAVSAGDVDAALATALSEQVLTITGGESGTLELPVGDADLSSAAIAQALNEIDGITAYSSPTLVEFGLDGITQAQDGDLVQFTLYVDGWEQACQFTVDASAGTLEQQFEVYLGEAAEVINLANGSMDLIIDGGTLESLSGATIGVQEFSVQDNAGILITNFQNFNTSDTLTLTLATDGTPSTQTLVEIDLTGVDINDPEQMSQAFYEALDQQMSDTPIVVSLDETSSGVVLRTTDGSSLVLGSAGGDQGDDASVLVTALNGSTSAPAPETLTFNGGDQVEVTANTNNLDFLTFSLPGSSASTLDGAAAMVGEAGGALDTSAVLLGSLSLFLNPGMEITSSQASSTGLFGSSGSAATGDSMITLGGTAGFTNFDDGDAISFELDGYGIAYTVEPLVGVLTDAEQARLLYQALVDALPDDQYEVILNQSSVSLVRTRESNDPIIIEGFTDSTGQDAALTLSTVPGTDAPPPENQTLQSNDPLHNSATAVTYGDPGVIFWEQFDSNGLLTGESGFVKIDEPGLVEIIENGETTLTFEISEGSLVAGNTLQVNINASGQPDPLEFEARGQANAIEDTYWFEVSSGSTLLDNGEPVIIEWYSSMSSGTLVLEGNDPPNPDIPLQAEVDGMTLYFYSGTLVEGDVFSVATDGSGQPDSPDGQAAGETLSDWHWTLDSFADEFNSNAGGVMASVTEDHRLVFDTDPDYCALENIICSGGNGFNGENVDIIVLDYSALDIPATDMQFVRVDGNWEIENDPTGGTVQIIPEGGDDDGFMVDLDGDGLGDIQVNFNQSVTGDGTISLDMVSTDSRDIQFAFAGTDAGDCGLAAAAGINTFFTGNDAATIGVNESMASGQYIASGMVDLQTGTLAPGDNANALAMADARYTPLTMVQWDYTRGEAPSASLTQTNLAEYENTLIAGIGVTSQSIQSSLEYSDLMTYQLTGLRDSISAVSLDEEMIRLVAYQQAYTAASKLLSTVDEMLSTLLSLR